MQTIEINDWTFETLESIPKDFTGKVIVKARFYTCYYLNGLWGASKGPTVFFSHTSISYWSNGKSYDDFQEWFETLSDQYKVLILMDYELFDYINGKIKY